MEVLGKVILLGSTEEVGQNGFTKRQLVLETTEQYPQKLAIDFVKDKTSILDSYKIGENVKVSINLRGSEYKEKYYVNLQGWKIEKDSQTGIKQPETPVANELEDATDLPF